MSGRETILRSSTGSLMGFGLWSRRRRGLGGIPERVEEVGGGTWRGLFGGGCLGKA